MPVEALRLAAEWALDVKPQPLVPMPQDDTVFDEKWVDFLHYTCRLYGFTQMAARLLTVAKLGEPMMRMDSRMMLQEMQVYYLRASCHRALEELRYESRVVTFGGLELNLRPHAYIGETSLNIGAHGITETLDSEPPSDSDVDD